MVRPEPRGRRPTLILHPHEDEMTPSKFRTLLLVVLALVAFAACGDDSADDTSNNTTSTADQGDTDTGDTDSDDPATDADPEQGTFPVTVSADNGEVTIEARPSAIVSISTTATEMLFAIDAGDQVTAVDSLSTYPPGTPVTDLSGYAASAEAVAALDPDLVVLSYDPGGVIEGLELLDIPVLYLDAAADMDGVYRQIEVLGAATGNIGAAAELVADMQSDLEQIVANLPGHVAGLTYFHELDDNYYTVTSSTFIGQVYDLLGLVNIADAADPDGTSEGYPQLSAEFIISADPDIIFLADGTCCGQDAETVAARPGWGDLTAVRTGAVFVVDEDVSSRWGPRTVDFLAEAAAAVAELEPVG